MFESLEFNTHLEIQQDRTVLTSIEGRSVIVTGASKGIGKGIARVFAGQGARVLLAARNLSQAEAVAAEIQSSACERSCR